MVVVVVLVVARTVLVVVVSVTSSSLPVSMFINELNTSQVKDVLCECSPQEMKSSRVFWSMRCQHYNNNKPP